MRTRKQSTRLYCRRGLITAALATAALPAAAQRKEAPTTGPATGTFTLTASLAPGGAYAWVDAALRFGARTYRFSITGLSVTNGAGTRIRARGHVYNLQRLQDFTGLYTLTVAEPATGLVNVLLRNAAAVQIRIDQVTHAAHLTAAADGVRVTLR